MFTQSSTCCPASKAGVLVGLLALSLQVHSQSRADCERDYKPQSGQTGKDVIWVPTQDALVGQMLHMANVKPADRVYDLGAGDGKIAIAAAKDFGATATGIEYNPDMVKLAQCFAAAEGVSDRAKILQGDIFATDFHDATVVTLYLLPDLNLRLRPTLLDMQPGTRVVSHSFTMSDWEPDQQSSTDDGIAYMWIVPAKVAGTWTFRDQRGKDPFPVTLQQNFQQLSGTGGKGEEVLKDAKLNGSRIDFKFNEGRRLTQVTGNVDGDRIDANVTRNGKTSKYTGTRT